MHNLNIPGQYAGRFEAHVTVATPGAAELSRFRRLCELLGVKCVLIQLPVGEVQNQLMTASYFQGPMEKVEHELSKLVSNIESADFQVLRVKLEAALDTEGVPQMDSEAEALPPENYFEYHIKLFLTGVEDLESLGVIARAHKAHLSRNAFKEHPDGKLERFLTMRIHQLGARRAEMLLTDLRYELRKAGIETLKVIREYSIFDTNESVDYGWASPETELKTAERI